MSTNLAIQRQWTIPYDVSFVYQRMLFEAYKILDMKLKTEIIQDDKYHEEIGTTSRAGKVCLMLADCPHSLIVILLTFCGQDTLSDAKLLFT